MDGLGRLLGESDWVVLAAALTEESRALLGADQLARMRPSAWLINIARGGLVDEAALIAALQAGRLAGACLDVFAREPLPLGNPLWDLPNVYVAPHNSSGWTPGLHTRQQALFLENLRRFAARRAAGRRCRHRAGLLTRHVTSYSEKATAPAVCRGRFGRQRRSGAVSRW